MVNLQDELGNTATHAVAATTCLEIARLLLNRGAQVNTQNQNGHTPLMNAASYNQRKMIQFLLAWCSH